MGSFSLMHWLIILFIVLLLFGPNKLPELGKSIGKAIKGFKDGMNEVDAEARQVQDAKREHVESSSQKTQQTEKTHNSTENKS
jgi:sec-independent protein translocase protein TatA